MSVVYRRFFLCQALLGLVAFLLFGFPVATPAPFAGVVFVGLAHKSVPAKVNAVGRSVCRGSCRLYWAGGYWLL